MPSTREPSFSATVTSADEAGPGNSAPAGAAAAASASAPLPTLIYISDDDDDSRHAGSLSALACPTCLPSPATPVIGYPVIWGRAIRNAAVMSMQLEGPVDKQKRRCIQSPGWLLFSMGFLCPLCWLACICLPNGRNGENRRAAIGSAVMLVVYAVLISMVLVFSLGAGSCTQQYSIRTCYNRLTGVIRVDGPGVSYTATVDAATAARMSNLDWSNMDQATANWKQFFAG